MKGKKNRIQNSGVRRQESGDRIEKDERRTSNVEHLTSNGKNRHRCSMLDLKTFQYRWYKKVWIRRKWFLH